MPHSIQVRLSFIIALASCCFPIPAHIITNRGVPNSDLHVASKNPPIVPKALTEGHVKNTTAKIAIPHGVNGSHNLTHTREDMSLPGRPILPNPLEDDPWQEAVAKGGIQLQRLSGPRSESLYLWLSNMTSTGKGWSVEPDPNTGPPTELEEAFEDLSISLSSANNRYIKAFQGYSFANQWHTNLPATRAYFNNYMNIRGKTIVGASNESPSHLINRRTYPDWEERLPDVKYFSDALWIEWATVARSQRTPLAANDLKYIFMRDILSNEYTRWVMEQCAGVGQDDFDEDWPGLQFDMGTPQFKALLGTNHGITVVNLLIQHPNELHDKTVESITIFTASYHTDYDILFTLTGAGN